INNAVPRSSLASSRGIDRSQSTVQTPGLNRFYSGIATTRRHVDHGISTADRVDLLCLLNPSNSKYGKPSAEIHSVRDLTILLNKAKIYTRGRFVKIPYFYRDKTETYFQTIEREGGLMKGYKKDCHGDPKSPINNRLDGLFFSVNIDPITRRPPSTSIYGDCRLIVPVKNIMELCPNIYFTDFYCVRKPHYVTLVLTRP
ncbi:hypothetical protein LSH36_2929g00004, partial [Paralvinella palmiformis]